jgi:hypothetical protein
MVNGRASAVCGFEGVGALARLEQKSVSVAKDNCEDEKKPSILPSDRNYISLLSGRSNRATTHFQDLQQRLVIDRAHLPTGDG